MTNCTKISGLRKCIYELAIMVSHRTLKGKLSRLKTVNIAVTGRQSTIDQWNLKVSIKYIDEMCGTRNDNSIKM